MSYQFLNNINSINNLTQVFTTDSIATSNSNNTSPLMVWNKPKGVRLISIICAGGGGGGCKGGYFTGHGGHGGGGGEIFHSLFLAQFVPDTLYIKVGFGGAGEGFGGVGPLSGGTSFVSISPDNLVLDNMLITGIGGASANPNSTAGGGSGGNSVSITSNSLRRFSVWSNHNMTGFGTGSHGGSYNTFTSALVPPTSTYRTFCFGAGGAGGGAANSTINQAASGGSSFLPTQTPIWYQPDISLDGFYNLGGASGTTSGGNAQVNLPSNIGSLLMSELLDSKIIHKHTFCYITGGSGGGGTISGISGNGGNGGPTCGGGGTGGNAQLYGTNGNGGNGGPGFVIISCSY